MIEIGNDVIIGPGVSLFSENHNYKDINTPIRLQGETRKKIVIEDDVWIGANAIILAGVYIGKHSVVGAGSVVTKDVPANSVVVGSPAKLVMG
jgi:acetyltransferase-like isoleucine patch superfamily enzyme